MDAKPSGDQGWREQAAATGSPVADNVDAVLRIENARLHQRSAADRFAEAIAGAVGTLEFVLVHVAILIVWTFLNIGLIRAIPMFDPFPFPLLAMIVSMEGLLIATFVLIKQNRMSSMADRRAHLDLQVNLLAEREITHVLQLVEQIARHIGLQDPELPAEALKQVIEVDELVSELDRKLSSDN